MILCRGSEISVGTVFTTLAFHVGGRQLEVGERAHGTLHCPARISSVEVYDRYDITVVSTPTGKSRCADFRVTISRCRSITCIYNIHRLVPMNCNPKFSTPQFSRRFLKRVYGPLCTLDMVTIAGDPVLLHQSMSEYVTQ